jgi:hypothetical protein
MLSCRLAFADPLAFFAKPCSIASRHHEIEVRLAVPDTAFHSLQALQS